MENSKTAPFLCIHILQISLLLQESNLFCYAFYSKITIKTFSPTLYGITCKHLAAEKNHHIVKPSNHKWARWLRVKWSILTIGEIGSDNESFSIRLPEVEKWVDYWITVASIQLPYCLQSCKIIMVSVTRENLESLIQKQKRVSQYWIINIYSKRHLLGATFSFMVPVWGCVKNIISRLSAMCIGTPDYSEVSHWFINWHRLLVAMIIIKMNTGVVCLYGNLQ